MYLITKPLKENDPDIKLQNQFKSFDDLFMEKLVNVQLQFCNITWLWNGRLSNAFQEILNT